MAKVFTAHNTPSRGSSRIDYITPEETNKAVNLLRSGQTEGAAMLIS
jgi:hypothetical protein